MGRYNLQGGSVPDAAGCYFNWRMGALIRPETSPNASQVTQPAYTEAVENEEMLAFCTGSNYSF